MSEENEARAAAARAPRSSFREVGVTGLDWTSGMVLVDPDVSLQGIKAIEQFHEMRYTDPTVRAVLSALELPIRDAKWHVNPASDAAPDREAAEFVESCMSDMSSSWDDVLTEACTMFPFGWSYMEWVLKRRVGRNPRGSLPASQYSDGLIGWRKLAGRMQTSWQHWDFDDDGNVTGMYQWDAAGGKDRYIPLSKALLFRTTREGNNPEGLSILRSCHREWKYKRQIMRIEAIGLQRALMGLPVVKFESAYTTSDQMGNESDETRAQNIIRALHDNRMMGVIEDPNMTVRFETPDMQGITGDSSRVLQRYDEAIARSALAQYIMLGSRERGSYALAKELGDLFFMSVDGLLGAISQVFSRWAVPVLFQYNYFPGITGHPEITTTLNRRVDLEALSKFINDLVGQQVIVPDEVLEQHVRSLADLPPKAVEIEGDEPVTPSPEESPEGEVTPPETELEAGEMTGKPQLIGPPELFIQSAGGDRLQAYTAATTAYQQELAATYEDWMDQLSQDLSGIEPGNEQEADRIWEAALLALLLSLQKLGWLRFPEAMALGYGTGAMPALVRTQLEAEIASNDQYLERNFLPAVRRQLTADQLHEALLLLWGGREMEFTEFIHSTLFNRRGHVQQYSGHLWRVMWLGAIARLNEDEDVRTLPIRWVLDAMARHCTTCLVFGDREYANIDDLMSHTGGILPGQGTECDGWCRCHLQVMREGKWSIL